MMVQVNKLIPGFAIVLLISFLASLISLYTFIGTVACAILLGILIANSIGIHQNMKLGISFTEKKILGIAIALMGFQFNTSILSLINYRIVLVLMLVIVVSLLSAIFLGKLFKLSSTLSILIGVGNGICGSSAIAATSSVIGAEQEETGLSITVINILGVCGIFLLPTLITFFGIQEVDNQGIIIGGTIQAVGQVTAAGFIVSDEVGKFATLIKMVRILMLGPAVIFLSLLYSSNKNSKSAKYSFHIPGFIIGFVVLSLVTSMNFIPENILVILTKVSKYFLIFAMSAIGLNVSLSFILDKGLRVISVGSITFLIQIVTCMFLTSYFL